MNLIKRFINWIMGWVVLGAIVLVVGFGIKTFSGSSDTNTTRSTKETTISKDEKLIEIQKEYWENGNLKSEIPYKKHYGLGWKKVKTTLIPHGIAKTYYENSVLESEDPYVDGERTGLLKFYDEEGKILKSVSYVNSVKEGKTIFYYTDGTVMEEEYYKEGNLTHMPMVSM